MLKWYSNKYVEIYFDNIPRVGIRYILPSSSKIEAKSIKKYPFINKRLLKVRLDDKKKNQEAEILEYLNFDWWKKKNDPHLEKYIVTAINNNHDIKSAALKVEQARLNVTMTRAGQLPTLSVGASPFLVKMPQTTSTMGSFALPIIAQYELDLFGKNWDKTKSSKKMLEGAEYQAQASDISIISHVGSIYYNIVKLDKIINIQEDLVKDREEIYRLMKLSNEEGIVSTSDLILSEKQFVMSQNDLIDYKKARENSLNALAVLIGDSPNNIAEYERISLDELSNEIIIPNEVDSEIIINRPDYKSIEKQIEAAGLDIRAAKKEFLPSINILGALAFVATSMASSMSFENALGLIGSSVNLPIFTGFKRTANSSTNLFILSIDSSSVSRVKSSPSPDGGFCFTTSFLARR